ncbi:alpha,alpha-trehalose-phosphate synthase, UDP-forming [Thraustotheca clavata]|uniref:Alpha,alpha-trehalose-phosphate synthase, UDP-forming n=1 Tax=Thraustotheca clavata TaxID=74557 RepID=A0A1W0A893_9STRA|nr:alpha,alpha-trehalose-phosphate synthase, UDP-forming [Thraustotheca clavata]
MSERGTAVIVCINVLPLIFTLQEDATSGCPWKIEWSTSSYGLFLRNIVSAKRYIPMYVGCPEVYIPKKDEAAVRKILRTQFNCIPVFLDPNTAHRHYQGFCKGVLWPIFHNVIDVYNSAELKLDDLPSENSTYMKEPKSPAASSSSMWQDPASWNPASQDKCWNEYCQVNRQFAKKVIENWQEGSIIWIHDFPLLVLASYLLRKLHGGSIAIFLHVPFPSSEIFRTLTVRTEILRAMLCANHIGFLVFEHARHFLTACKRLLGLNYKTSHNGMLTVEYNGRLVLITCSHCGTELHRMSELMERLEVDAVATRFKEKLQPFVEGKFVLTAVDRLEGLCGIPLKLRALDRFLAMYPSQRGKIVLIQAGISIDSRPNDYNQTKRYVESFVAEINRRWGTPENPVVVYEEFAKMNSLQRMVVWKMGHVFLDTCVRGGLSMLPFEFLSAHHHAFEATNGGKDESENLGILIASEFASYSRILNGALLVNPWRTDDVVSALVKAMEMQFEETRSRFLLNYNFLLENPVSDWGTRMLADIESAGEPSISPGSGDFMEIGFGFDYRVMQFAPGFVALDVDDLLRSYVKSTKRLVIFDYGGTLSWTSCLMDDEASMYQFNRNHGGDVSMPSLRKSDGQVRTPLSYEGRLSLESLCHDPFNVVVVWSNACRSELEREFGTISELTLIADNGYFIKKTGTTEWVSLYADTPEDLAWKDTVADIIKTYVSRTNGSFVVIGDASVMYDYRNCDPEYGEMQAAELFDQLTELLKKEKTAVLRGKGFVEVHRFGVNKAIAVTMLMNYCTDKVSTPDFVLCIGDDESDEQAYRTIRTLVDATATPEDNIACYTVTVGKKPSLANYYLDSVSEVLGLVESMAAIRNLIKRRASHPELEAYHADANLTFQANFRLGGLIVSPIFVRNLSREFNKVVSTTNLEDLCIGNFDPTLVHDKAKTPEEKVVVEWDWNKIIQGVAAGAVLGWTLRHQLRRYFN